MSTKFFWGLHDGPNEKSTLNRKYLMQAIDGSLARFGLDYVDLVFCHRADPDTPLEETVFAMSDIVASGKAHYWGTSEWTAAEIAAAWHIADRHHLHKPVMEQPQYNLLHRERVEREYARLYADMGLGTTIWSPLASGLLTGKYNDGVPADSRGAVKGYEWLAERLTDAREDREGEEARADRRGPGMHARADGARVVPQESRTCRRSSRAPAGLAQVQENMQALAVVPRLMPDVMASIDAAIAGLKDPPHDRPGRARHRRQQRHGRGVRARLAARGSARPLDAVRRQRRHPPGMTRDACVPDPARCLRAVAGSRDGRTLR